PGAGDLGGGRGPGSAELRQGRVLIVGEWPEGILLYPSYGPHLDGHGTIPSSRSVGAEETPAWQNAVARGVTPPERSSGGGRSDGSSAAGSPSATSAVARG